jgi:hypothetical protein
MRVERTVQVMVVNAQRADLFTSCNLSFTTADPYAVRLSCHVVSGPDGRPLTRHVARELLLHGVWRFSGSGDVRVLPAGEGRTFIGLHGGCANALLELRTDDLIGFLCECERLVPFGTESSRLDRAA